MNAISKSSIKADNTFDKVLKEHVEKKQRRALCITIRDNKAVLSGDAESVAFAENNTDMTVQQLMDGIVNMDSETMEFKSTQKVVFPPMSAKFRGRRWNLNRARDQPNIYLDILGFGKGGRQKV